MGTAGSAEVLISGQIPFLRTSMAVKKRTQALVGLQMTRVKMFRLALLWVCLSRTVSVSKKPQRWKGREEKDSYTGPACVSRAAKSRLRAELNSISQRMM